MFLHFVFPLIKRGIQETFILVNKLRVMGFYEMGFLQDWILLVIASVGRFLLGFHRIVSLYILCGVIFDW